MRHDLSVRLTGYLERETISEDHPNVGLTDFKLDARCKVLIITELLLGEDVHFKEMLHKIFSFLKEERKFSSQTEKALFRIHLTEIYTKAWDVVVKRVYGNPSEMTHAQWPDMRRV